MTLGDLLLENRIIFLQGEIYDGNANELVMKLLYLQSENRRKDIHFYINSPGGSVTATLAIYDTMQILTLPGRPPTASAWRPAAAAVLLAGGTKGKRFALPTRQGDDPPAVRRRRRPGSATSKSRPTKSSARARCSTRFWPSTPASRSNESPKTPTAITS